MSAAPAYLRASQRSADRGRRLRLEYEGVTAAQDRWAHFAAELHRAGKSCKRQLWRAANQCGKSRGSAKKILHFIRGTGPYADRKPGPKKVLIMSFSKEQMEPLMEKLWDLLPKDEIGPEVAFEPGFGFRGKPPRITLTSGPGAGSLIVFATYKQGSRRAAGGTFDVVVLDEPVEERIWGEIQPRVLHGDPGEIWITFTPTPDSPPLEYLREMVKKGQVQEMNTELTVENVTVIQTGRPLLTQEQIDDYAAGLLELEKDMRLRGGWEIIATDRALDMWGAHCQMWRAPPAGCLVAVGIDHGASQGKQAAAIVCIADPTGPMPQVWVLGESVSEGYTTSDMDAQAILDMLRAAGLSYDDVDVWMGDRATGLNRYDVRKTNGELRVQLARLLGRVPGALKMIEVPHKFDGSVGSGYRVVNSIMGRRHDLTTPGDKAGPSHFLVAASCVNFANAAKKWKWNPKDREKDILDAVRYPIERVCKHGIVASYAARYN